MENATTRIAVRTVLAVVGASLFGLIAAYFNDDERRATWWLVHAAVLAGPMYGFAALFPATPEEQPPPGHEDSVEHDWLREASSGAFFDIVLAVGVGLFVVSLFNLQAPPFWIVLPLAGASVFVRYVLLKRARS